MAKINVLSPNVYNRIAAGEVVDRPYSVVKELVENALDAGASEIEIRIEKGGKSYISVLDNGGGIEYADLKSVFLPHATSKISKAQDLEHISTLGFRGEAVASVSAVSHMRYTSKCAGAECYQIACDGGEIGEPARAAGAEGTLAEVEDLFYNTPVRLKFLKSDKAEEADITTFVNRFILSRPEVRFRYFADGRLVSQSFGGGEEEALVSVYGANILRDTYRIDGTKNGIRIRGYISNQNFFKPNRSYQSVFLNGRFVVNATLSAALTNAYASYTMKRQYPFYVLYVDMSPELVDVNVHPNKADVRFADNQVVYGALYGVVSSVLDGNSRALEYVAPDVAASAGAAASVGKGAPSVAEKREDGRGSLRARADFAPSSALPHAPVFTYEQAKSEIEAARAKIFGREEENEGEDTEELPFEEVRKGKNPSPQLAKQPYADLFFEENTLEVNTPAAGKEDFFEENKKFLAEEEARKKERGAQMRIDTDRCEYKGNLFNTFLLYECGDSVYIIDQHAAHERLIFDRLRRKAENREIAQQPMLVPYERRVTPVEAVFLEDCQPALREIGFEIAGNGDCKFTVTAVPLDLQAIALDEFFDDVLGDISGLKGIKLEELLRDRLAMAACKAAVKGGMSLTEGEVKTLLADMDGNAGLKCPHGRPAVVRLTKYEIEKMFKRIV